MTIGCPHCGELFKSLLIETPKASTEVYDQYLKHFTTKHRKEFQEFLKVCMQVQALAAGYMLMNTAEWAEDDTQACEAYKNAEDGLLDLLGFDSEPTEEEVKTLPGLDTATEV